MVPFQFGQSQPVMSFTKLRGFLEGFLKLDRSVVEFVIGVEAISAVYVVLRSGAAAREPYRPERKEKVFPIRLKNVRSHTRSIKCKPIPRIPVEKRLAAMGVNTQLDGCILASSGSIMQP